MKTTLIAATSFAMLACLSSRTAHADESPLPQPTSTDARSGFVVTGTAGADFSAWSGGLSLATQALFHYGPMEVGARGALTTNFLGGGENAAGLAGARVRLGYLYADALGELGTRRQSGIGRTLLGGDPGATATVPYAGLRLDFGLEKPDWPGDSLRGLPVLSLFAGHDLTSSNVTYTWVDSGGLFSDSPVTSATQTSTVHVGGGFVYGIALGGGFDIH